MKALKQFLLGVLTTGALLFLFRSFFCAVLCTPDPCLVPNPAIQFNVEGGNFGVIARPVAGASSVKLDVYAKDGALAFSATPAIGAQQIINLPTAQRPLQLVFSYNTAGNDVVAADSLIIDDRQEGGVPIVDIVIGVHNGANPPQACPNIANAVTVAPISAVVSKFTWAPGKQYKLLINHGTQDTLLMRTEFNGLTGCYKVIIWRQDEFGCLTQPTIVNNSTSEIQITTGSGNVKITGTDNCDGTTPREITFRRSNPTGSISVLSD